MAFAMNRQKHFVQNTTCPWLGASTLQLIGVALPKLRTPLADGFMGDVDPAFAQQLLYIAVAQGEPIGEPEVLSQSSIFGAKSKNWVSGIQ